jgi:sugar phosphate isomerase/epimerase
VIFAAAASGAARPAGMGIATTCYMTAWKPKDTAAFLEHAIALGAGGIQAPLSSTQPADLKKLRDRAAEMGLYIEIMAGMPRPGDTAAFVRTMQAAREAGALCVRCACLGSRRYETFSSLDAWREHAAMAAAKIDAALAIAERERLPLAIENHKDWTLDELVPILRSRSSQFLGVCLDTGNNIALLDDPMEVVETLAPYAVSTHIKDMGLQSCAGGFLLAEMPLGQGTLDMRRILDTIRRARPDTRLTLEMITRDPLRIPCLEEKYWATFPDRRGASLARILRMASAHSHRQPLPLVSGLDRMAQLRLEEDNVRECLAYARTALALSAASRP